MVRFANPEYFYLYWLVPVLIVFLVWVARSRNGLLNRLGDAQLIRQLTVSVSSGKRLVKRVLIVVAYCLLVLALANPQIGTRLEEVKREGIDIFIALDVSKSMLAEDIAPNRFDRARQEISKLIDMLQGDRIGLIVFSGVAFVQCPLTLDYSAAKLFLNEVAVGDLPQPGTSVSDAIETALASYVDEGDKNKALIVITDGEDHEGDPVETARSAAEKGLLIYTVGIGSPAGAPIPEYDQNGNRIGYKKDGSGQVVTTRLDVQTLERIAAAGNGKFVIAGSGSTELDKIYSEIYALEKKELSVREFTQYEERFQIFLFLTLLVLMIETFISERRNNKKILAALAALQDE